MSARFSAVAAARATCLAALVCFAACTGAKTTPSLTSPSPAATHDPGITLTVRVQMRGTDSPISGALVTHQASGYYTDTTGESRIGVTAGAETTIAVSALGFHAMEASGVLNGDERWTFFLEADGPGPQ